GIIVEYRADALRVDQQRADWVGEIQGESLVAFRQRIAVDGHGDEACRLAGQESYGPIECLVVAGRDGRPVESDVVDGDVRVGRRVERDSEDGAGRAGVAFRHCHVVDPNGRRVDRLERQEVYRLAVTERIGALRAGRAVDGRQRKVRHSRRVEVQKVAREGGGRRVAAVNIE